MAQIKTVAVNGEARQEVGKRSTKALRHAGKVPCVIYGGNGENGNVHFSAPEGAFKDLVYTPDFVVADINVGGNVHRALVKDLQFHPVTDRILHIDFQELTEGKETTALIPIRLEGLAVGVRAGGKLMLNLRALSVRSTPENLVPEIVLDVSDLELGKAIRVRDIELEGVEVLNPPATPVAAVEITRALRAAQAAAAKAG